MSSYRPFRISDFCTTGAGGTPSRNRTGLYYEGGSVPWVKSGELREGIIRDTEEHLTETALKESNLKLLPVGTLLLAMYGATVGRLGILGVQATTNQAICHIIPDPAVAEVRYLFHALRSQVSRIVARGVGGAQPNINQGIVRDLTVILPALSEQRQIAEVLDRADALRAKRRAALAQLDTLTQSIFIAMFGDPATNPKGWPICMIGDIIVSASYGTSEKASMSGEFPVLRMNNITSMGKMDFSDLKFMDLEASKQERYLVKTRDILFNRTNSAQLVGKTAIFRESVPMAYAGYLIRLRVNSKNDPEYLSAFLNTNYSKRMLRGMCKSIIGMANINATEIQAMKIAQPPLPLQCGFAKRISSVIKLADVCRMSLVSLDALFASLQHRAFRGEL